jgi:hypothetical protein
MRFTTTLAATALLLAATAAGAAELDQTIDRTLDVRAGATFYLDNTNGGVHVRPAADNKVHLHAVKHVRARSEQLQSVMNELKVEITQPDGGVRIVAHYPKNHSGDSLFSWIAGESFGASVSFELQLPQSMIVDIQTVNGRVDVNDLSGALKLETTNGGITLERCRGSLQAETTNGRIDAELLSVTAGRPIRLGTTNGGIKVALPRTLAATVDASTTNGRINTELPVTTTSVHRSALRGTLNGGGPELKLSTTNGGIDIVAR